jgi:hypothetical protein
MRTIELPVTAYRGRPQGPDQLDDVVLDVQGGNAVGEQGVASVTLNLTDKSIGTAGLTLVRVGIAVPSSEIVSLSADPSVPGLEELVLGRDAVWRVPRLGTGSPGPNYTFSVTFKPQVAGTLRIAFTGRAGEFSRTFEYAWDLVVPSPGQP